MQDTLIDRKLAKKAIKDQLSLERVLEETQAKEQSITHEDEMHTTRSEDGVGDVNRISGKYSRQRELQRRSLERPSMGGKFNGKTPFEKGNDFGRSGRQHDPQSCPVIGRECRKCGRASHFERVCRSNRNPQKYYKSIRQVEESTSEEEPDDGIREEHNSK